MRILNAAEVMQAVTMRDAIDAVRLAFIALSTGKARVPLRVSLQTAEGATLLMPAYLDGAETSTVKVVSVYPGNGRYGLPTILASVLVMDAETGQARALMDGTYLTALRTGAASGLATDLLARRDAMTLGVIGAGAQARTQIAGVCAVRAIGEIRVYSRSGAETFVQEIAPQYPDIRIIAAHSRAGALDGADVIVAATTSVVPVVTINDIRPGVHINGVGLYTPTMQEVSADVIQRAHIVVDSRDAALAEAGDLLMPISAGLISADFIVAEIGEIAVGLKPGRTSDEQITFFKSVGVAVQDAAVAALVVAAAEAQNLGIVVNL